MSGEACILSLIALLLLGILIVLINGRIRFMKSLSKIASEVIEEVVGEELPETDDSPLRESIKKVAIQTRDQVIQVRNKTAAATAEKVIAVSETPTDKTQE